MNFRDRKSDTINSSDALACSLCQHLAQLCDKALIAEGEMSCCYHYGRNFVFQEDAMCNKNKIGEKKAN